MDQELKLPWPPEPDSQKVFPWVIVTKIMAQDKYKIFLPGDTSAPEHSKGEGENGTIPSMIASLYEI